MQELSSVDASWEGRCLLLCEPEGWYGVAIYSAKRQEPIVFSEDYNEIAEEIQYRSSQAAATYIPKREYIYVPHEFAKTIRAFGAEYDYTVASWYVPDDMHNIAYTKLDTWRNQDRVEYLKRLLDEEQTRVGQSLPSQRIYLNVPFKEKDLVKYRGAVYDAKRKAWYIDEYSPKIRFAQWLPHDIEIDFTPEPLIVLDDHLTLPMWLFIPVEEQGTAKLKGAIQYQDNGLWFAPVGANPEEFDDWNIPHRTGPKLTFLKFLAGEGYDVERNDCRPIPDGKKHSFFVQGDEDLPSGQYCLFMRDNEIPGGWVSNAKSQTYLRWNYPHSGLNFSYLR